MIRWILIVYLSVVAADAAAQSDFPVREWPGTDAQKPFVFYITGDGGFNTFSTELCTALAGKGFPLTSLNAKSYFWNKKSPEQTATDVNRYLTQNVSGFKNIVLIGYSFGADVLPFIMNKLPETTRKKISSVVLLSPSATTDFEIHFTDMLGSSKKRSMAVAEEINKMNVVKIAALFGSDEKEFPVNLIKLRNFTFHYLPGGHHFEGNTREVANAIISNF